MRKWGGGEILKRAVSGMLPKNRLRKPRLERLKGKLVWYVRYWPYIADLGVIVFEGHAHPYRENLIKFDGLIRKREPEVSTELLKRKSL